jgi:hypothetical protein
MREIHIQPLARQVNGQIVIPAGGKLNVPTGGQIRGNEAGQRVLLHARGSVLRLRHDDVRCRRRRSTLSAPDVLDVQPEGVNAWCGACRRRPGRQPSPSPSFSIHSSCPVSAHTTRARIGTCGHRPC